MNACGEKTRASDEYGFQIQLATLPGSSNTDCHDAISCELFDIIQEARLPIELQPHHLFHRVLPPGHLLAPGATATLIPDASIVVALVPAETRRGHRRGRVPGPRTRLLFDVKTIHGGSDHYLSAHARDEQSGAVRHREAAVWPDYLRHAGILDARFSRPGTTPITDHLRSFGGQVRGLVFGAYGEASADVHDLLSVAADALAAQLWRLAGARGAKELRSFVISQARRRVGMAAVQAMARHRLARVPYIGVPRAVVSGRMRRGMAGPAQPLSDGWGYFGGFYAWQTGRSSAVAVGA